jgi:hypothetical protein
MKKQTIMIITICFTAFLMPGCGTKDSGVSPDLKQSNVSKNDNDHKISKGQKPSETKKTKRTKPYGSDRFGEF